MTTIREILATGTVEGDNQNDTIQDCESPIDSSIPTISHIIVNDTGENFTYDAIELAYGDILGEEVPNYEKPRKPTRTPSTIQDEENLDSFWEQWNLNILRDSIKLAATILRGRSQVAAHTPIKPTDASLQKRRITWRNHDTGIDFKPDWVVFENKMFKIYREEHTNDKKAVAYIVGDRTLTEKWKSSYLRMTDIEAQNTPAPPSWKDVVDSEEDKPEPLNARGTYNAAAQRLLPLQQLATYCRFAETRYSFLVTQDEVVVFRIRRLDVTQLLSCNPKDHGTNLYAAFEYKPIPWNISGTNRLNFNLAVWALACMGMNDYHREMEGPGNTPLDKMARLTHWVENKSNGEYTNIISGRVIKKNDWARMETNFVNFTTADGYSNTQSFYTNSLTA